MKWITIKLKEKFILEANKVYAIYEDGDIKELFERTDNILNGLINNE